MHVQTPDIYHQVVTLLLGSDHTPSFLLLAVILEELWWVLKAKADDMVNGFKKGETAAAKATTKITGSMTGMYNNLKRLDRGIQGLMAGLAATIVYKLGEAGLKMAETAGKTQELSRAFFNLASAAGVSGDKVLSALRRGLGGTLSTFETLQEANRALISGLPASAEKMEELALVARGLGRAVGIDAAEAFQRLVKGISKQEIELLDELFGGSVKFIDILRKLPASASAAEKQMAIYNAVLSTGKQRVAEMGGVQETFVDRLARTRAKVSDAAVAIGEVLIPVVEKLAELTERAAKGIESMVKDETIERLRALGRDDLANQRQAMLTDADLKNQRAQNFNSLRRLQSTSGQMIDRNANRMDVNEVNERLTAAIRAETDALVKGDTDRAEKLKEQVEALQEFKRILEDIQRIDAEIKRNAEQGIELSEIVVSGKSNAALAMERIRARGTAGLDIPPQVRGSFAAHMRGEDPYKRNNRFEFNESTGKFEHNKNYMGIDLEIEPATLDKVKDELEGIPELMESRAQEAFNRMGDLAAAFGLNLRGILGGAFNISAGLKGLQGKGLFGNNPDSRMNRFIGAIDKFGMAGQVIAGGIGLIKGIGSFFGIGGPSTAQQVAAASDAALADMVRRDYSGSGGTVGDLQRQIQRAAQKELENRNLNRQQQGELVSSSITTLTNPVGLQIAGGINTMNVKFDTLIDINQKQLDVMVEGITVRGMTTAQQLASDATARRKSSGLEG